MLNKKIIAITLLFFCPYVSYAMFCPTNFNLVSLGDSIDSVKEKCGKPDSEKTKEMPKPEPQEWTYFTTQTVSTGTSYQATGTLKTTVTFDKDDKAINISVNGIGVGESTICGTPIQLNNSRDQVKAACGEPSFINKQGVDATGGTDKKDVVTEYTYNANPPFTFIFTNSVLTGTKP